MGKVTYRLAVPLESKIPPVFHISFLKRKIGTNAIALLHLPPVTSEEEFKPKLETDFQQLMKKRENTAIIEALVSWVGLTLEDGKWEALDDVRVHFPNLVNKVI